MCEIKVEHKSKQREVEQPILRSATERQDHREGRTRSQGSRREKDKEK